MPKPTTPPTFDVPTTLRPPNRQQLTAYNKSVGKRIREARRLAGLSRAELVARTGIPDQWMKRLEAGVDAGKGAPGWAIHRIARQCGVKGDFLLGLTEESEPDSSGPTWKEMAWLSNHSAAREREQHALDTAELRMRLSEFRELAANVDAAAQAVQATLERVAELNPEWEDMRAGARLAASVEALHDAVGGLGRRSSAYVARDVVAAAPETLEDLEIASA